MQRRRQIVFCAVPHGQTGDPELCLPAVRQSKREPHKTTAQIEPLSAQTDAADQSHNHDELKLNKPTPAQEYRRTQRAQPTGRRMRRWEFHASSDLERMERYRALHKRESPQPLYLSACDFPHRSTLPRRAASQRHEIQRHSFLFLSPQRHTDAFRFPLSVSPKRKHPKSLQSLFFSIREWRICKLFLPDTPFPTTLLRFFRAFFGGSCQPGYRSEKLPRQPPKPERPATCKECPADRLGGYRRTPADMRCSRIA